MKTKQQESITAGRRAEQEEALRIIGENAAEIIHELKAPLSNIMAYMQLIERRLQKAGVETQDLPFPVLYQEIKRMGSLCQQSMALISATEEQPGPLDMGELCNGTAVLFRALTIAQGIDLVLEIPKELVYVFADENQLRRLLINLVANAAQVLRGYREDGRIKVSLKNADEGLVLMVQDNGPGMDAQTLERIFDRFYTTKKDGSGMGLPICAQIAKDCHGTLTVFSEVGQGSSFVLWLPAAQKAV